MRARADGRTRRGSRGRTDWAKLDAATDGELETRARSDPDNPPLSDAELRRMRRVPLPKAIRHRLGMTQEEFARSFHLSLATIRDWEQGRYQPDRSARTLLRLIALMPDAVRAALEGA
jgi:putative transcriptional regulator